jgi:LuxR family maltose regulon positive regulatory protein
MSEPDLLVTQFSIPPVRAHLLPRTPLMERLYQSSALPMVLVSAGAGFGKTTLLAAWAGQCPHPVAWLSLNRLDNDPYRFWRSLIAALRTCLPTVGAAALMQMHDPQPPHLTTLLTTLINELAAARETVTLILDDYHVLDEPSIHASLLFLIEHAPAGLHLILSSRVDPPLALSRLRARGQMAEFRDADLRVSEHEAADFLSKVMGVTLSATDAVRLAHRTEGWLTGLQLAALSLSHRADPSTWVQAFGGSQRLIQDYLHEEVLARQPPALRRFLLRACILPQMEASLCQAVTGNQASQQMLETLERAHLFVIPLDERRQWYRLHDLFREALLARLQAHHPELVPTLYERASHWYEAHGWLPEAVEAALSAGAFSRAAILIERSIDPASLRNEFHTLCRWLGHLPQQMLQDKPVLSFRYAQALMFTSPRRDHAAWERIEPLLWWAEHGFAALGDLKPLGEATELHAALAFFQGDLASAITRTERASSLLTEHNTLYAASRLIRGLDHLLAGDLNAAWQNFLHSQHIALSRGDLPVTLAALLLLGEVCLTRNQLQQSALYAQQALAQVEEDATIFRQQLMTATGERDPFFVSWAYHQLARLAYEHNDLAAAQQYLTQAQELGEKPEAAMHLLTSGRLLRVRVLHHTGETVQAQRLLHTWERQAHSPWEGSVIRTEQARLNVALGNLPAVERWYHSIRMQEERELPYLYQEAEALVLVRLHLALGQAEAALQELARWQVQATAQGRTQTVLEILILEALAHSMGQAMPQATTTLLHALRLAQPENAQRLFIEEGRAMFVLLRSTLPEIQEPALAAFTRRLVAALTRETVQTRGVPAPELSPLHDPLTPQELRVLHLLAEGASNRQIAEHLVIQHSTARKHVSNLLSKLEAESRTQAIARAREFGLLPH